MNRRSNLFALCAILCGSGFAQTGLSSYKIVGNVARPGIYPLALPTRIFDAIAAAGGFRDPRHARDEDIVVFRGDKQLKFNWNEFSEGRDIYQNLLLNDEDCLIVGKQPRR